MLRVLWTHEEVQRLIPKLKARIDKMQAKIEAEQSYPIKGLPPMTTDECIRYFNRLIQTAADRPLSEQECFLHGQLLSVYQQACFAEALGEKGRFFVIPESTILKLMAGVG